MASEPRKLLPSPTSVSAEQLSSTQKRVSDQNDACTNTSAPWHLLSASLSAPGAASCCAGYMFPIHMEPQLAAASDRTVREPNLCVMIAATSKT